MKRDFKHYQQTKANIEAFIKKVQKLGITNEEWDAVSYFCPKNDGVYTFLMIKFLPDEGQETCEYEMNEDGLGPKYLMIHADDGPIVIEEAVLGDPTGIFLNNLIRSGHQGYLIRKCPKGIKMAQDIAKHAQESIDAFKQIPIVVNNESIKV